MSKPANMMRSGAWLVLDNASAAVIAFCFFIAMARSLSMELFGIAVLTLSVVQILGAVVETLFHDALIQREDLDRQHVSTATIASIAWGAGLAVVLFVAAPGIALLLKAPVMTEYLRWIGLALVFTGIGAVPAARARRDLAFKALAIRTLIARVTGAAIGIAMLATGYGVWAVIAQFLSTAAVSAILLVVSIGIDVTGGFSRYRLKQLLAFAAPAVGTQMLLFANARIIALLIGALMGPTAAGLWQVAFRFVEPVQLFIATTIGQLSLPILSRRQSDVAGTAGLFLTSSRYNAILVAPIFVGIALCAPQIVTIFVGERWLASVPLMQVVAIVTMIAMLRQLCEIVLSALGRPSRNFATHALAGALSLAGAAIGAPFGLFAATLGWASRALSFVFAYGLFVRQATGLTLFTQFRPLAMPVVASGAMAAAVIAVQHLLSGASVWPLLIASVATGAIAYGLVLSSISPAFRGDVRAIIASRRPRST